MRNWDQMEITGIGGEIRERARTAEMLIGDISKCVDIPRGIAQRRTRSPTSFNVSDNGLIVALEAAMRGVKVREFIASGLIFAD